MRDWLSTAELAELALPGLKEANMAWWEVKQERAHGGLIYGKRRATGDKFEAPDSAMAFDEMEGVVARCDAPNAAPAKKSKGDAGDKAA